MYNTIYIIYITTNKLNNHFYIGQHKIKNKETMDPHYYGSGLWIKNSKKKYKDKFQDIFEREILEVCFDRDTVNIREIYYISHHNTKLCKNIAKGGEGGCTRTNFFHTQATKDKISKKNKNRKMSDKQKIKLSIINVGKKHSEETKKKISKSNIGKHSGLLNKNLSILHKKKISDKLKGRISPMLNRSHSKETILQMSISSKNKPKLTCPHCGKICDPGNAKRWHFNNCKQYWSSVRRKGGGEKSYTANC